MCTPTAMVVMSIASMGMQMVAAGQAAAQQKRQLRARAQEADYKAKVAKNNATVAEWMADDELKIGQQQAERHRRKVALLAGRQRAVMAGSGFKLGGQDAGSEDFADIQRQLAYWEATDIGHIRANAERRAYKHRVNAMNASAQGSLFEYSSQNYLAEESAVSPLFQVGAAGFKSGSSVAEQWYSLGQSGAKGAFWNI